MRRIVQYISENHTSLALAERGLSIIIFLLTAVLLATDIIPGHSNSTWVPILVMALMLYLGGRLAYLGYLSIRVHGESLDALQMLEVGGLVIAFLYLVIYISGGTQSAMQPVLYLAISVLCTFSPLAWNLSYVCMALAFEIGIPAARGTLSQDIMQIAGHTLFIWLFAGLPLFLRRFDVGLGETRAKIKFHQMLGRIESEAKRMRVGDTPHSEHQGKFREKQHDLSTYFEVHDVIQDILKVLALSQNAYTCAVMLYFEDSRRLRVIEAFSSSNALRTDEFSAEQGVLHGVIGSGNAVRITCRPDGPNRIGYYFRSEQIRAMAAQPIKDEDRVVGILAMDRTDDTPISDDEMEVLATCAAQVHRAMANENLLRRMDNSQKQNKHLAEASKLLAMTLDMESVLRVSLQATHEIASYDLGAIAMLDEENDTFKTVACHPEMAGISGMSFDGKNTLIDWVVRNNQSLSYGDFDELPRRPTIFMDGERMRDVRSLLIIPLKMQAKAVGAFIMVSNKSDYFPDELRYIFEIIVNQIAVSLENAQIYQRMEEMATTDGLTGLYNKRFFNERMEEILSRAERHEQQMAMMVLDLDHFKQINDTYGHLVGDVVLKDVAHTLRGSMRKTDLLARFGGEEFTILLDGANAQLALTKADELREAVSDRVFDSELGQFSVNVSIGISIFPEDARTTDDLLERADEALYRSKRAGRNRCTLYREIES